METETTGITYDCDEYGGILNLGTYESNMY